MAWSERKPFNLFLQYTAKHNIYFIIILLITMTTCQLKEATILEPIKINSNNNIKISNKTEIH